MVSVSIRISEKAHMRLREMAQRESRPISKIAEDAIAAYEREQRWQAAEAAMRRLRENPAEYEDYLREQAEWDNANLGGLEGEPWND